MRQNKMQFKLSSGALIFGALISVQANAAPPRVAPAPLSPATVPTTVVEDSQNSAPEIADAMTGNPAIFEVLEQLRLMQTEISELRELAEQQEHQMSLLTKRQRSLYQDMDRRLLELEAGGASGSGLPARPNSGLNSGIVNAQINSVPDITGESGSGIVAPGASVDATAEANEKAAYTRAFNILKEGNYTLAITTFREFLQNFPSGKYADNSQYWLGEAIYATRDYKTALAEFNKILTDYQDSPKRKDAEIKIGFTYYELKNWAAARQALEGVVQNYPDTTNARTAQQRLERMTREGR
jgi:tol-pal system protein YbgF